MAIGKYIMRILKAPKAVLHQSKQTIALNQMQKEVIVDTLHSDRVLTPCMPLYRGKARAARWKPTWRVQFEQSMARADYIWHLYDLLGDFVGTPPRVRNNIWGP